MISPKEQFQKVYQNLNQNQRTAVDTIEGPVMVIAGPGTGKTIVLTARIAKILETTDVKPYNILALTFTDSAAAQMRPRLVDTIGSTGYYVRIETFHAFCSQVIQEHPEYFSIQRGSSPLTELEKFTFFENILLELKIEAIKPLGQPLFYIGECIAQISNLKREGYLPQDFEELLNEEARNLEAEAPDLKKGKLLKRQKNLQKQQDLLEVYKLYQQHLRKNLRYDFDDMIMLVMEAFEQEEMLLREYQEEIHYFLVDEYQDTNAAQNKIVDLLASWWGENANLFVVGDPHQSIYRFQGASMENMLGFMDRYPKALVINLEIGYRCTQQIYNTAHTLIQNNSLTQINKTLAPALNQVLQSPKSGDHGGHKGRGGYKGQKARKVRVYQAPSQIVELMAVASQIKSMIESGVDPEEIAVLYHNNAESIELAQTFDHYGIKYEIDGGGNVLESNQIKQFITLLRVVDQLRRGGDADQIFEVLCFEWTSPEPSLGLKLVRAASKAQLSIIEMILSGYKHFSDHHLGPEVTEAEFASLESFTEQLFSWGIVDAQMTFPEWFEFVLEQSGYLDWILQSEFKAEYLSEINALYREVKSLAQSQPGMNLASFIEGLDLMYEHKIRLEAEDLNIETGAVRLSTVHKAKGQEWRYVFIIHCLDKRWGNLRDRNLLPLPDGVLKHSNPDKKEKNEDERRLFYVALTRAKDQVYVSYPATIISGAKSKETVGSMFLTEISGHLEKLVEPEVEKIEKKILEQVVQLLRPPKVLNLTKSDEAYFKSLVDRFSLSATSLNTYLKDPQEFILNSLLRVPRAKPEYMAFGTAVHGALEYLFSKIIQDDAKPEIEKVWQVYERFLKQELLISLDFDRRLGYGKKVLENYWQNIDLETTKPLFLERQFGYGISKTMIGDIALTGRIDRVDWLDKTNKTVRVIDYKTGKNKSNDYINGVLKSSPLSAREMELPETIRGSYQRQLVFYKLLTELDNSFVPEVMEAAFEFVEPDKDSGKIIRRNFTISAEAVSELKKLIKQVMTEIRTLQFLEFGADTRN